MACEQCGGVDSTAELAQNNPGYRRALIIVIVLNLGMGMAEMIAGLIGASQALMADALDFLGDGSITLLGLLSLHRPARWRAWAALLQGAFLALLGVGIIAVALFRTRSPELPEASLMTGIGAMALLTNVAAALVLVRYRRGDASVRAVWLFSRNDALGNAVVIAAGVLVFWSGTRWPDLLAAITIAGLFLSSSLSILRSAWSELTAPRHLPPLS